MPEIKTVELSDSSIAKLVFEMGRAMMLPPKETQADSARAGRAFVIALDFTSAAGSWITSIVIPPAGGTRLQVFDAILYPGASNQLPYLCFFKGELPAAVVEATTDDSKPSTSAGLAEFTPREIYQGRTILAAVEGGAQVMNFKAQSGLGEPGEGLAIISRSLGTDFGEPLRGNFTYREIIDPR